MYGSRPAAAEGCFPSPWMQPDAADNSKVASAFGLTNQRRSLRLPWKIHLTFVF